MLHQRLEKRRQQAIEVIACGPCYLASEERYGILEQVEQATQLIEIGHGLGRGIFDGDLLTQGEDR